MALQSRAFVKTGGHSEKGGLLVTMTAAFSALSTTTSEEQFGCDLGQRYIAKFIDND
jgi:hypothetical protein